jgi:hypothetical protein
VPLSRKGSARAEAGRLERIAHLRLEEQKRAIEDLEARMKILDDALAV